MRQELIRSYSRAALALLMMVLTTATAWAQEEQEEPEEPEHVHDFSLAIEDNPPTCTESGSGHYECICGEWGESFYIQALGHAWDYSNPEVTLEATCVSLGRQHYYCPQCGEYSEEEEIPATGVHNWDNWYETTSPTCTQEGEEERTCLNEGCDATETRPVNRLAHNIENGLCTVCGGIDGVSYIDENGDSQTEVAIPLTGGSATTIPAGWYVVNSDVTYTGTVTLGGNVNIILADGKTMTVKANDEYGIYGTSKALTIYGQTLGTGTLNATDLIRCDFITMIGGTVNATSNPCGIAGNVTVSGGTLNATGQYAIGGNVTVTGGTLTATSTDIALTRSDWPTGYNTFAIYGNLALSGPATVTINGYVYEDVTIADGLTFTDGTNNYSGTLSSIEEKISIYRKTLRLTALQLANAADNTAVIANCNGATGLSVTLSGRTLTKNNEWNTLCLPFNVVDGDNTDELTFTGTPLEGATVKELLTTSNLANDGTLTLNFSDNLTAIEAGKPYIVKWEGTSGSVSDPVFSGVTVTSTTPIAVTSNDGKVKFVGQYSPFAINEGNIDEIIMLSTGNKLGYSQNPRWLRSFRAHFEIPTNGGAPAMNSFVLNFDDESTGISLTPDPSPRGEGSEYYTLDGRKLSGKPTTKGLYIHNGKKVVLH